MTPRAAKKAPPANVRHSKESVEWFTPEKLVAAEREVMGEIDLDPLSCAVANKVVKATAIFTRRDDGLAPWNVWRGRLHVNPHTEGLKPAWQKLVMSYEGALGGVRTASEAFWVGYSLEQLQVLQVGWPGRLPFDYPMCYLNRRLRFWVSDAQRARLNERAREAARKAGRKFKPWNDRPSHANYIVYMPRLTQTRTVPSGDYRATSVFESKGWWDPQALGSFERVFAPLGRVVIP